MVGLLASKGDFKPLLNIDEVDAIFDAPLEMFLKVFLLLNLFNFELPTFSWVINPYVKGAVSHVSYKPCVSRFSLPISWKMISNSSTMQCNE